MPLVNCPNCGEKTEFSGNDFRPFCSERCKLIDFGDWIDGAYSLPTEPTSLTEEDLEMVEQVRKSQGID